MGIEVLGMERLQGKIARVSSGALQTDLVDNLHRAGPGIRAEMSAHTFTKIQRRAMDSVQVTSISNGLEITGGRGGGLGQVLFMGGEYGGRKSRRVSYATHSPSGRPYRVSRRTTMQFLPHLGRLGYFFNPTIKEALPRLIEQATKTVNESLG